MPRPIESEVGRQPAPDWLDRPERSNPLSLRLIVWVAMALGRPAARLFLPPICLYFLLFSARARSASGEYLRKALGRTAGFTDSFRHYHAFASTILDRVFLLKGRVDVLDVSVHGAEIIDEMAAQGRGCILLGAHLGSFEVVRAAGRLRVPQVNVVMYEDNARMMGAVLDAINPALRVEIIALGKVDSILKVEAALGRGEIVGMLADRTLRNGGTMACPFLGEDARFPTGPIRIARMLKRPIALMFGLYRGGNRYEIHIERFADLVPEGARAEDAEIESLIRRYAGRLEHYCRLAPYNWFNFHDFWR